LADAFSDLHLVPSEADRVTHPTARRFVEGRGAYWNRDTVAAVTAFEEVMAADWNEVSENGRKMLVLQAFEEARDWSGAAEAYQRLGLQDSHSARLRFMRTTASFPSRKLEFGTQATPITFDLHRGQLVILDARMEGRPVRLMVDTGFSSTFVTADFARQAGLLVTSEIIRMSDSNDSESPGRLALLGSMEVAGVTVRNLPVVTAPPRLLRKLAGPIDGVLGWDVLRDMVVTWDFPSRQMILRPSVKGITGASGNEPANLAGFQQPVIRATAASGRPLDLFLDTGFASRSMGLQLNRNREVLASKVALSEFRRSSSPGITFGMHSLRVGWPKRKRPFSFYFAGYRFEVPQATLSNEVSIHERLAMVDGVVGNAPFLSGRLTVDAPNRFVGFEECKHPPKAAGPPGHGGSTRPGMASTDPRIHDR
jgi:hypothetical protein